jgi:serine/threonine protein kinase/WD40 repeat protein
MLQREKRPLGLGGMVTYERPADESGFRPGSVVAGYRLEAKVGEGGMAAVYRARDERLHRLVALKILAPEFASDPAFRRRFIGESEAAAAVDHPHIIPIYFAGDADGVLFISMRFVHGGDLRLLMRREGLLPPARVAEIISPVASALDAAHDVGLVHRDVKPGNILIDTGPGRPDHVLLSDFGISKSVRRSLNLTSTGQFLGTAGYSAPEQIEELDVDGRTDQYALACVTYELLTGEKLFQRSSMYGVLIAHVHDRPPALTSRRQDLPLAADAVMAAALAKTPAERYASCADFADALRAAFGLPPYHAGRGVLAPPRGQLPAEPSRPDGPGPSRAKESRGSSVPEARTLTVAVGPSIVTQRPEAEPGTTPTPVTDEPVPALRTPTLAVDALSPATPAEVVEAAEEPQPAETAEGDLEVEGVQADPIPTIPFERASADTQPLPVPDLDTDNGSRLADGIEDGTEAERVPEAKTVPGAEPVPAAPHLDVVSGADLAAISVIEPAATAPADEPDVVEPDVVNAPEVAGPDVVNAPYAVEPDVVNPPYAVEPDVVNAPDVVEPDVVNPPYAVEPDVVNPPYAVEPDVVHGPAAAAPGSAEGGEGEPAGQGPPSLLPDIPVQGAEQDGRHPAATPARDWRRRLPLVAVAAAIIGAAVTIPFMLKSPSGAAPPQGSRRPSVPVTSPVSARPPQPSKIALPPSVSGGQAISSVAVSPSGTTLAVAGALGTCLWNIPARSCTFIVPGEWAVAFSPDGKTLVSGNDMSGASGGANGIVRLRDAATGRQVSSPLTDPDSSGAFSVAFSPDGKFLAVGDGNGNTYLWDVATRTWTALSAPRSRDVNAVAFAANGKFLAVGDANGDTYLWDVATRTWTALPDPQSKGVNAVAFSPDGKTLAAADGNGNSYLWNVATRKLVTHLNDANGQAVRAVAFSPNGAILASGDHNGITYLWNTNSGTRIGTLPSTQATGVTTVAFANGGTTLVSGYENGTVDFWPVG